MSSTFLPRKFDNETGVRSPIVGRVKSGCLSPTFGAYGAAEAREVEPSNHPTGRKGESQLPHRPSPHHSGRKGSLDGLRRLRSSASVVWRSRYPSRKSFCADHSLSIHGGITRIGHAFSHAFSSLVIGRGSLDAPPTRWGRNALMIPPAKGASRGGLRTLAADIASTSLRTVSSPDCALIA